MDVESVDCSAVAFRSRSDQGFAALRLLDNIQYWVFGICGLFVTEIHACGEANVDAAGGEPEIDVRRHYLAALATRHTSRFDGADRVETGGEIRPGSPPAPETPGRAPYPACQTDDCSGRRHWPATSRPARPWRCGPRRRRCAL